jgi:hypothetical protein
MTHEQKAMVRARVEAVVDRLTTVLEDMIAALDQLDGDPDLESSMGYQPYPDECEGDGADNEPSLGWTATVNQSAAGWRGPTDGYGCIDREDEHDGREPDADLEPTLGGSEPYGTVEYMATMEGRHLVTFAVRESQAHWAEGATDDREAGDDNGIADSGGADEFHDQHRAMLAFDAERERTNPAQAARDLQAEHGVRRS